MKAILQRVSEATIKVDGEFRGEIGKGLVVLLGIKDGDTEKDIDYMINKIINLRIFDDEDGKLNKSLLDESGELMIVSNFTLYGDTKKGRRPSYIEAAKPDVAKEIYNKFIEKLGKTGIKFEQGEFQAYMEVDIQNDGPITLIVES